MTRGVEVGERWGVINLSTGTVASRHLTYGQALANKRWPLQDVQYLDKDGNIIPS